MGLLTNFIVIESLEDIGDECKKIAREIRRMDKDPGKRKVVIDYLEKLDDCYRTSMRCFYKNDKLLAGNVSVTIRKTLDDIDSFTEKETNPVLVKLANSLRNFLVDVRGICRASLNNT